MRNTQAKLYAQLEKLEDVIDSLDFHDLNHKLNQILERNTLLQSRSLKRMQWLSSEDSGMEQYLTFLVEHLQANFAIHLMTKVRYGSLAISHQRLFWIKSLLADILDSIIEDHSVNSISIELIVLNNKMYIIFKDNGMRPGDNMPEEIEISITSLLKTLGGHMEAIIRRHYHHEHRVSIPIP